MMLQSNVTSGYIDLLDSDGVQWTLDVINSYEDYWIRRGVYSESTGFAATEDPVDFYTLGAATYIDCKLNKQVYEYINEQVSNNLRSDFDWLYDTLVYNLWDEIGPCEISSELAPPGFHIFGCKSNEEPTEATKNYMEKSTATIHVDLQQEQHMSVWDKFDEVDLVNCLSFTLPLQIPISGAGLNTWEDDSLKCYELNDDYCKSIKKLDYGEYSPPNVVIPYSVGKLFYFIGPLKHQIAPGNKLILSDRRITLQGHGVKCDGVWQLYF
jgi:hypothetical protein